MKKLFCYITLLLTLNSCAQYGQPGGGPEDKTPPQLVKENSDKNYQTNFSKKTIRLSFDEWIQVSNPVREVAVSPPTSYPVQVTARGKSVVVEFSEDEQLKADATYQVNFGDAVRDFTEGNIYKNLVFVFATGDIIDSLSVSGQVRDALSGEPLEDIVVCLYENLSDSAFVKEPPFYFTKTDKSGKYKLSNIRNDTFQVFALKDENVNYYYDRSTEQVAYLDSMIFLLDSSLVNINLELFDEDDPPRLVEYKERLRGLIKLFFNPPPIDLSFRVLNGDSLYLYHETVNDSIYLWHNGIKRDSMAIVSDFDGLSDTIVSKMKKESLAQKSLKLDRSVKNNITFHESEGLELLFNKPLLSMDTSLVSVSDSLNEYFISDYEFNGRTVRIEFDSLAVKKEYSLEILPEAVMDIYGSRNSDTLSLIIKTHDPDRFGTIALHFVNESDTLYLVNFMKDSKIISSHQIDSSRTLTFNRMAKGKYGLRITEDGNNDGRWTSGNVISKRPPERIKNITLEELKAGWELKLDIIIKEIFDGAEVK